MSRLAIITFLDQRTGVDIDNTLPGGPVYPGQGLPGGGYPSQGLPGGPNYPSQGLPGGGGHPSQGLPGHGHPDNSLPGFPGFPVHLPVYPFDPTDPGFGVGRPDRPDQGLPGSGGRPDQGLPGSGARPDQGLPGQGGHPDNTLPGGGARPSQPIHDIRPGMRFMVKWLVCGGLILVPDNELPSGPPPTAGQPLPPTPEPKK
jgi:hypothetical protein